MKNIKSYQILKKIKKSFAINSKIKIFFTAFLIFISSVLILFSLLIPISFFTYSSGLLEQINPYKSYVNYYSNPFNSPVFNYGGEDGSISPKSIKKYSTFGWYNPDKKSTFINRNPIAESSVATVNYFAYLSGIAINNNYIEHLNHFPKDLVPFICDMMGDTDPKDQKKGIGACFKHVVELNAPYFVKQKIKNPNFSLTFGLTSFNPSTDEHIVNIPFSLNHLNINLWGINPFTSRLNQSITEKLKKFWTFEPNNIKTRAEDFFSNPTVPVVINQAAAKLLNIKVGSEISSSYNFSEIDIKNENDWIPAHPDKFSVNLQSAIKHICTPPTTSGGSWNCTDSYKNYQSTYLYNNQSSVVKMVHDGQMKISSKSQNVNYKIIAISKDIGFPRFYTVSQITNYMLMGNANNIRFLTSPSNLDYFWSFFGYDSSLSYKPNTSFYNSKLTNRILPFDLQNYNVNQPYNDYSQFGLNGGKVQFKESKQPINFTQNGKSIINNLFSWDIMHESFWQIINSVLYLILLIIIITVFLAVIIMTITTNSIMVESRKQIVLLKAFGYSDREILKVTSGYYIFILTFAFILSSILTIFLSQYLFYIFFASKNIYIPFLFQWWVLIIAFIFLLVIYYINKFIAWKVSKNFVPAEAVKVI